jgi:2-oxoglutarate ferredoxin oxidoreductase subunit beta
MNKPIFAITKGLTDKPLSYCPGCTHGIIHRLVAEALEGLGVLGDTIGIAPVGCAVMACDFFNCDMVEAAHGRAPAVATGLKRADPSKTIFTYQGDGDLASIGLGEFLHAAGRGEHITVIFVNNTVYGMTGGQMAPTTLVGQCTSTSPQGRDPVRCGYPMQIAEMAATLPGAVFVERVAVFSPRDVRQAGRAIREAFITQRRGLGFSLVEVLSTCPVAWKKTPVEALAWGDREMKKAFPVQSFRRPAGLGEEASHG